MSSGHLRRLGDLDRRGLRPGDDLRHGHVERFHLADPLRVTDLHGTDTSYFRAWWNGFGDVAVGLTHVPGIASQHTFQSSPDE
jgi:hypothetical protein